MHSAKQSVTWKVIDHIKQNIADGNWAVGDKIPSENTLTRELGVSRASVRLALQRFIAVGVLESRHGKGSFVVDNDLSAFVNLSDNLPPEEYRDVAKMLEGKQVANGVSLQIWTDIAMQQLAKVNGYEDIIKNAGAHLLNSGCPLVCGRTAYDIVTSGFLTDGAKQAHYVHTDLNSKNCKVFYGDTASCIEAAIKGRWEG